MNSHLSRSAGLILNFRTLPLFHLVSKGIFDFNCVWISNWRSPTRKYAKIHPSIHKEVYGHRDQYVSSTNQKVVPARCLHFLWFSLNAHNSRQRTQIEWYQESARLKINYAAFSVEARPSLCIYVVGHCNSFCLDIVDAFWYLCFRKTTNPFLDSICVLTERYLRRQPAQMLIDWPPRGNHQGSLLC